MNDQELRLECVRVAANAGGDLDRAREYYDFVTNAPRPKPATKLGEWVEYPATEGRS